MSEAHRLQAMAASHQIRSEQYLVQARLARVREQVQAQQRAQAAAAHNRHYEWAQTQAQRQAVQQRAAEQRAARSAQGL